MSENTIIRPMVRGNYAIQKLRIQMGNRITANFKAKLGMKSDGMTEDELEKQSKMILANLRQSYIRITDGIVAEGEDGDIESVEVTKFPSPKKFIGDELISTYAELVLVDQYMELLRNEVNQFKRLGLVLKGIPIYDEFLSTIPGIGPAMAGVLISEIDIHKAEYPSSLHKYAGLDVVVYGAYTNDKGVEKTVRGEDIEQWLAENPDEDIMLAEGKYPVKMKTAGRNRKDYSLVKRPYTDVNGDEKIRDSITFNPFLKTKLVGVVGSSFLRSGKIIVDGLAMGAAKRQTYAVSMGFQVGSLKAKELAAAVMEFLHQNCDVVIERSIYTQAYYGYKQRLEMSPFHTEKTDKHRHNMAIRYAVKIFLNDLYKVWRELEGLVAAVPYAEKIGVVHGVASIAKNDLVQKINRERGQLAA